MYTVNLFSLRREWRNAAVAAVLKQIKLFPISRENWHYKVGRVQRQIDNGDYNAIDDLKHYFWYIYVWKLHKFCCNYTTNSFIDNTIKMYFLARLTISIFSYK